MRRITRRALPLTALICFLAAPVQAQAGDGGTCQGDVQVQTNPLHNRYDCTDCRSSVIVQVGTYNDVNCGGDTCAGNVVVQVGTRNSVDCAAGLLLGSQASTAASQAAPPCPPSLPKGNFYCHVAAEMLPREVCLTFDLCLW